MKILNKKVIILAFLLTLLMYPQIINTLYVYGENLHNIIAIESSNKEIQTDNTGNMNKIKISIIFDDGWESVYTLGFHICKSFDFKASIGVIPELVGQQGFMDENQLTYLYLKGWDMLNHTYTHSEGMYEKCDELLSDFNRARKWLDIKYLNKSSNICIVPYGELNPCMIQKLRDENYRYIRTSDNILILDDYKTKYKSVNALNLLTNMPSNEAIDFIYDSYNCQRDVMIIMHKLGDAQDSSGMTYSADKFSEILKYIHDNKQNYQVVTFSKLINEE